jgi:hypothetical protein
MKTEGDNESEPIPKVRVTVCVWIILCIGFRTVALFLHAEALKNYSVPILKPTEDSAIFLNRPINLVWAPSFYLSARKCIPLIV